MTRIKKYNLIVLAIFLCHFSAIGQPISQSYNILDYGAKADKIGNVVIGALAGEFFAETGLWLKENSPVKNYFSIGLANGCVGYVPPAHEIERGGYETWRCRTSKLDKGSEVIVREKLMNIINKVALH
jgi:hypothetical protein